MSIDKLLTQFKTPEEKDAFIQAQIKTLNQIQKKNKELEDEVVKLKKDNNRALIVKTNDADMLAVGSSEEEIARIELNKLKVKSMDVDPLTLEDAKKVEIYAKILNSRGSDKDNKEREVQELGADALLALVESPEKKAE